MGYIYVIIFTLFFTSRTNLMYGNMTGSLMLENYHWWIVLHLIICASFFAYKTLLIYQKINIQKKIYLPVIITALAMIVGALCPYTLNSRDLYSLLHVYCSLFACISFLILLWIYTRLLSIYEPTLYNRIHWFYNLAIQFIAILSIVLTRINGYIEILFTLIVCGYLYMIERYFKIQENDINKE